MDGKQYEDTKECFENTDITEDDIDNMLCLFGAYSVNNKEKMLKIFENYIDKKDLWEEVAEMHIKEEI